MPDKIEILNELKEISPLLYNIGKDNPFAVPSGYFEQLPIIIMATIHGEGFKEKNEDQFIFSNIPSVKRDIPGDYFESLSGKIMANIKKDESYEELHEFPLLVSLKGYNVFTVPHAYFENTADDIINKIPKEDTGKIVSINRGKLISMNSTWWKAASAAVIAGVIAVSSYFVMDIQAPAVQTSYVSANNKYTSTEQVNLAIASLTDDEIADYLEDHGNILDNNLLIKDVSTKGLPAPEDYLLDDNTLNNYLNEIGALNAQKIN